MDNIGTIVVSGVAGVIVGGVVSNLVTKKVITDKKNKEIEELIERCSKLKETIKNSNLYIEKCKESINANLLEMKKMENIIYGYRCSIEKFSNIAKKGDSSLKALIEDFDEKLDEKQVIIYKEDVENIHNVIEELCKIIKITEEDDNEEDEEDE